MAVRCLGGSHMTVAEAGPQPTHSPAANGGVISYLIVQPKFSTPTYRIQRVELLGRLPLTLFSPTSAFNYLPGRSIASTLDAHPWYQRV